MSFASDLEDVAGEADPIEQAVIGEMGWGDYGSENVPGYADIPKGKVLSWTEARPLLSFDYSTGFGAPECLAVYAWTARRVLFVVQYDGATRIHAFPRNPTDIMPMMPGG